MTTRSQNVFSALKKERIKHRAFPSRAAAASDVFDYIDMFYNPFRRLGSDDGMSTVEYEKRKVFCGKLSYMKCW